MTTKFSISQTLTSGLNTITLPQTNLTLIGISVLGIPYMGIQLSPGKIAYIPLGNPSGAGGIAYKDPMFRVVYTFDTINFYVSVPNTPTSPAIFYFGDPTADSINLEDLTGVVETLSLTQGTSAGVMNGNMTFQFPEGKILLTGYYSIVNQNYAISQFQISTGKNIYLFNANKTGQDVIHPLEIEGAQSFVVSVSAYVSASTTSTIYGILYYKVLQEV